MKKMSLFLSMLLIAAMTGACGGGGGGNANSSNGEVSGITVTGAYGAKVFVPTGALSSAVTINIDRESANAPDFPPSDVAVVGANYEITPHGTAFSKPVTVTVPFDPALVPAGATSALYKAEPGGEFSEIASTVVGSTLVAQVTDFSHFVSAAGYPYLEFGYITGANVGAGTLYGFSADAASAALTSTAQASYANGASVASSAVDPKGRFYYAVTNILGAPIGSSRYSLKQYTIDGAGALVPVVSVSEFPLPPEVTGTSSIVVSPTGKNAYLVGGSIDSLQYSIGPDGALASLSTPTIAGGGNPRNLAVAPSGKHAYTVDSNEIRQYAAAADGALTSMSTATAEKANGTSPRKIIVDPSGKYAYVLNSEDSVSQYTIGNTGTLTSMTTATIATGVQPLDIIVHPSGKYLYVINYTDPIVSQYAIGANGALAPLTPATAALPVTWLSFDPSGKYAYGAANWNDPNVLRFKVTNGLLSALGTATALPTNPANGMSLFGKILFAKKPITPGGSNTGIVTSSPSTGFFGYTTSSGSSAAPSGGTSNGAGPFNLSVGFGGFGGWITGGGYIDCEQGSITRTTCSAMIPSGVTVGLRVTHTDANTYNVQWGGACSGTNFTTSVNMNSSKGCTAILIPCTGTACTSR